MVGNENSIDARFGCRNRIFDTLDAYTCNERLGIDSNRVSDQLPLITMGSLVTLRSQGMVYTARLLSEVWLADL